MIGLMMETLTFRRILAMRYSSAKGHHSSSPRTKGTRARRWRISWVLIKRSKSKDSSTGGWRRSKNALQRSSWSSLLQSLKQLSASLPIWHRMEDQLRMIRGVPTLLPMLMLLLWMKSWAIRRLKARMTLCKISKMLLPETTTHLTKPTIRKRVRNELSMSTQRLTSLQLKKFFQLWNNVCWMVKLSTTSKRKSVSW